MKDVHHNHLNFGFSLVELLIAMSLGLMVIASVTSVFLKGSTMASSRSLYLLLQQDTTDVLRTIQREVLRAGYTKDNTGSLRLSGAENNVIYFGDQINDKNKFSCVGFVYNGIENNGDEKLLFRGIHLEENKLKLKLTNNLTQEQACTGGQSLFFDTLVSVEDFEITPMLISSATTPVKNTILKIKLKTKLVTNSEFSTEKEMILKLRNWSS